jgi:two-component system cell cycle response regulator DivK
MTHSFDSSDLGDLASDADRLSTTASELERRLTSLVNTLEADGTSPLLKTLGELRVSAREQRRIADTIRARLIGDIPVASGNDAKRPLVLIVDDSPDNRDMAAMLLETSGFDTITAGNGLEGVIVAHYTRPAVVIMDLAMPVLDGVQATRLLKASQATSDINVIAYTARMTVDDDAPAAPLFVDVLRKPASPESIVGLVQRFAVPDEPSVAAGL